MGTEYTLAVERCLKMWVKMLKSSNKVVVDADLVELWEMCFKRNNISLEEIAPICASVVDTCEWWPSPAEVIGTQLSRVRNKVLEVKLGSLIKAKAELGYTVLTTPDQVHDGEWVGLGGNGVPLDELEAIRAERRLPTRSNAPALTVRARLKALKALAASNPIEMDGGA